MSKEKKPIEKSVFQDKLTNWVGMLDIFRTATENELWDLLKYETKHRKRLSFAMRIHGVANQKRYARERKEVMAALIK